MRLGPAPGRWVCVADEDTSLSVVCTRSYCTAGADQRYVSVVCTRARMYMLVLNIATYRAPCSTNVSSSSHSTGIYFRFQLRIGSSAPGPGDYDITVSQVEELGLFYLVPVDIILIGSLLTPLSYSYRTIHNSFLMFLFNTCRSGIMLTAFPFPAN